MVPALTRLGLYWHCIAVVVLRALVISRLFCGAMLPSAGVLRGFVVLRYRMLTLLCRLAGGKRVGTETQCEGGDQYHTFFHTSLHHVYLFFSQ